MEIPLFVTKDRTWTLNNNHPCWTLGPHELAEMQNCRAQGTMLVKRGGTVAVGSATSANRVQALFICYRMDGTDTPVRIRCENGAWQYTTGTVWSATGLTGWSTSARISGVVYADALYVCNGTDTPRKFPLSDPTTYTTWGTLPAGFNPAWITARENVLVGGKAKSNRIYFSDIGGAAWQDQNWYAFPDDVAGGNADVAVSTPDGILLTGGDIMGVMVGNSPLDHAFKPWPRRSALLSPSAVADFGGYQVHLGSDGPEVWDGFSQLRNLDPKKAINFSEANLADQRDIHLARTSPYTLRVYYRSRGQTTTATTATVTVASYVIGILTSIWTFATRLVAASTPTVTSNYYEYNMLNDSWSGPHTGEHSCVALETASHGDRQFPWVGHASNGKVLKADQDTFTDDGSPYKVKMRTSSFGLPPYKRYKVNCVRVMCRTSMHAGQGITMRVITDENIFKPRCELSASIHQMERIQSGAGSGLVDRGATCELVFPLQSKGIIGYNPQIEIEETSDQAFALVGVIIDVEEIK